MAVNLRTVTVNFRGTANALRATTRGVTSEFARMGGGISNFGRHLGGFVSGGVSRVMRIGLAGVKAMAAFLFILPAAFLALVNPATVVTAAMVNFSRAVNATSPEEFVAATRNMAPSMKEAVFATRLLHPELKNLYGTIQQGFWLGFATDIASLARVYFPLLGKGLGDLGALMGRFRHALAQMLLDPEVAAAFDQLLNAFASLGGPSLELLIATIPMMIQMFTVFANVMSGFVVPALIAVVGWLTRAATGVSSVMAALGGGGGGGGGGSGGGGGGGGGIGGWIGGIASTVGGWLAGLTGRAAGGPVLPGHSYLVGESGAEVLRMGGSSGTVHPNAAVGGDTYVTVKIGETELRGIVSSEVSRNNEDAALSARAGPGWLV